MKLDPNRTIGGQRVRVVRDLLRDIRRYDSFAAPRVNEFLGKHDLLRQLDDLYAAGTIDRASRNYWRRNWHILTAENRPVPRLNRLEPMSEEAIDVAAETLITALLTEGLIERAQDRPEDKTVRYELTIAGQALAAASFTPRMNRAKANALLKSVLERVAAINADPELIDWVTEVRVFGSYLTDSNDLGDLDVFISTERRIDGTAYVKASQLLADKYGPQNILFHDALSFARTLVRRRIKARQSRISLHNMSEYESNPALGGKTVYTFRPPKKPKATHRWDC